eukprot:NODE_27734_length_502_cov_14.026667.p2 GENE.NODE_27734_length_502_cov_14.026667~~NODE_27734_length_502_cov_14.026667.p2  ORF type:complete len:83 (-),score=21.54 NODE_27734_length_502_cov_14.026667:92-340(-)
MVESCGRCASSAHLASSFPIWRRTPSPVLFAESVPASFAAAHARRQKPRQAPTNEWDRKGGDRGEIKKKKKKKKKKNTNAYK